MSHAARAGRRARSLAGMLIVAAFAWGCGVETENTTPQNVSAEVNPDIATVVKVTWTTEKASTGYVEYGPTEALGMNTPLSTEDIVEHEQLLLGLRSDTVYYYRVVTWDGADAGQSDIKSVRTGYLPSGMPQIEVEGSGHDEFAVVPLLGALRSIVILDPEGQIVWYHTEDLPDDSDLETYRARVSQDGQGLVFGLANISGEPAQNSEIVRISFDGTERERIPIEFLAHDFVEHEDGTLAALVLEDREEADGTVVRGNKLVEIAPDGTQTDIWSSWNCFDWAEDPIDDPSGWTFANALDFDESDDVYYVGMRNFSSIARVSRETGECEWVLGFTGSTLEFAQGTDSFQHQHQFQVFDVTDDDGVKHPHLLVFDNEGALTENSRVLEYELDLEANTATEVWSYVSTPPILVFVLGEPTRYSNGDTFITWSSAGQMERVSADGESLWKLKSSIGAAFGFSVNAKTLYPPGADLP